MSRRRREDDVVPEVDARPGGRRAGHGKEREAESAAEAPKRAARYLDAFLKDPAPRDRWRVAQGQAQGLHAAWMELLTLGDPAAALLGRLYSERERVADEAFEAHMADLRGRIARRGDTVTRRRGRDEDDVPEVDARPAGDVPPTEEELEAESAAQAPKRAYKADQDRPWDENTKPHERRSPR